MRVILSNGTELSDAQVVPFSALDEKTIKETADYILVGSNCDKVVVGTTTSFGQRVLARLDAVIAVIPDGEIEIDESVVTRHTEMIDPLDDPEIPEDIKS